jgi:DNA mismatch endonuclease (patch repair protein)
MRPASVRPSTASSPAARRRMQANRGRDTAPELAIRREMHRRGYRYRVDVPVLPGLRRRADLVFSRQRVAVFVDGCFWHGCPVHGTTSKANQAYWVGKIAENRRRDADTDARLIAAGWCVLRVWEHEPVESVVAKLEQLVRRTSAWPLGLENDK